MQHTKRASDAEIARSLQQLYDRNSAKLNRSRPTAVAPEGIGSLVVCGAVLLSALSVCAYAKPMVMLPVLVPLAFGVLLMPTGIALHYKHPQVKWIAVLNIAMGWTVVAWVAAFIWAVAGPIGGENRA